MVMHSVLITNESGAVLFGRYFDDVLQSSAISDSVTHDRYTSTNIYLVLHRSLLAHCKHHRMHTYTCNQQRTCYALVGRGGEAADTRSLVQCRCCSASCKSSRGGYCSLQKDWQPAAVCLRQGTYTQHNLHCTSYAATYDCNCFQLFATDRMIMMS
jgi:hypothetical protein